MRIPPELEQLVRSIEPSPPSLSAALQLIEARKALEVEHYLRACALRLDLDEPGAAAHAGV